MIQYLLGFLNGVTIVVLASAATVYYERSKLRKETKKQEEINKKYEAVRPRLKRASDINARQLELYSASQQPSMNGLHSKYKNDLIFEIKELEKEKRELLQSIINEGFDPDLSVTDEKTGKKETMKLSTYMVKNGIVAADSKLPPPLPGAKATKNKKFFIIEGGKSDVTH